MSIMILPAYPTESESPHRDVKLANIFLVKLSESKILYKIGDPGIAKNNETIFWANTLG